MERTETNATPRETYEEGVTNVQESYEVTIVTTDAERNADNPDQNLGYQVRGGARFAGYETGFDLSAVTMETYETGYYSSGDLLH